MKKKKNRLSSDKNDHFVWIIFLTALFVSSGYNFSSLMPTMYNVFCNHTMMIIIIVVINFFSTENQPRFCFFVLKIVSSNENKRFSTKQTMKKWKTIRNSWSNCANDQIGRSVGRSVNCLLRIKGFLPCLWCVILHSKTFFSPSMMVVVVVSQNNKQKTKEKTNKKKNRNKMNFAENEFFHKGKFFSQMWRILWH